MQAIKDSAEYHLGDHGIEILPEQVLWYHPAFTASVNDV